MVGQDVMLTNDQQLPVNYPFMRTADYSVGIKVKLSFRLGFNGGIRSWSTSERAV